MNKRQRKKEQQKIKTQVIEYLEIVKSNSQRVMNNHKHMDVDTFGIIIDRIKDEIKEM